MKSASGWAMKEGNKYLYVQIGAGIFRVWQEYEIEPSDLKDGTFASFLEENSPLLAKVPNQVGEFI